ncbi:MAG: thioredoxin domain-containing protein [Simkaniaceae bacterium]|nr:thioredoxin domain-containing protein [Simkaniaceae bacterium]
MKPPRALIAITLVILLGVGTLLAYLNKNILPTPIPIQTNGNPTLGSSAAEVEVILFTDPKCISCKKWHDSIFPELQSRYIQTEKVRLAIIPVSVVPGSNLGSNALLCIYHQAPLYPNTALFMQFLSVLYENQNETWTNVSLIDLATKTDVTINLPKLKSCTDLHKWDSVIAKNTAYARELTGNHLKVPTLFVNGIRVKEVTLKNLFDLIELTLKQKEVKP